MDALPSRLLLGPGPSPVPPEVLAAIGQPTIGHLDPAFLGLMDRVRADLKRVFATDNQMTLAMSGTGSAGMETVFVNLVEPGDRVLVGVNGVFGRRMVDVAERCGAEVVTVEAPWGRILEPDELIDAIARHQPALVAVVHAETSTGVHQPVDRLGAAAHAHGALFLLDCVTSLGGMPVEIDRWQVDAAYSGTQKCLSCPPGLAPVTLSTRALERLERRRRKVQSWYLDLTMLRDYWGSERVYHHTAPINMLYALHRALELVLEEGLPARFERHLAAHRHLAAALAELGTDFTSQEDHRLPMLNAIAVPPGVDDVAVRKRLLTEFGIEIGGGLGELEGRAWRVGLMGHGARTENVDALMGALRKILG